MTDHGGERLVDFVTESIARWEGYESYEAVGPDDDGDYRRLAEAIVADLGLRHVGWYYRQADEGLRLWSSNVAKPPDWPGVEDVEPMFAAHYFGSSEAQPRANVKETARNFALPHPNANPVEAQP